MSKDTEKHHTLDPIKDIIPITQKTPTYQRMEMLQKMIIDRFQKGYVNTPPQLYQGVIKFLFKKKITNNHGFNGERMLQCLFQTITPSEEEMKRLILMNSLNLGWIRTLVERGISMSPELINLILNQEGDVETVAYLFGTNSLDETTKLQLVRPVYAHLLTEMLNFPTQDMIYQICRQGMTTELKYILDHDYQPDLRMVELCLRYGSPEAVIAILEKDDSLIPEHSWKLLVHRSRTDNVPKAQWCSFNETLYEFGYRISLSNLEYGFNYDVVPQRLVQIDETISHDEIRILCELYHQYPYKEIKINRKKPLVKLKDLCQKKVVTTIHEFIDQHPALKPDTVCLRLAAYHKLESVVERFLDADVKPDLTVFRYLVHRNSRWIVRVQNLLEDSM